MSSDPFGTGALRDSVLASWRGSPTRFREDANAEEDLRLGGYRDRLLVEIAQNAADAAGAEPGVLRLSVVDGELRAANTGAPLDADGVAALASLRASAKSAGTVGRFGVGFAAVLAVTDAPRVVSSTGGVAFSADRTREALPDLAELRGGDVPVLRLVWPTDEGGVPEGFTTEVRLPLRPGVDSDALVAGFVEQVPDLLLALPGLGRVEIGDRAWSREEPTENTVLLHGPAGTTRWLVHRAGGELPDEAVSALGVEAQDRPRWTVCWAVPLRDDEPVPLTSDVLHAPTPTDERLSLPARLLATMPVEPSRRRVLPGPATTAVLTEAAREYPALVAALPAMFRTALVPLPGFPLSEVDDVLRALVLARLRETEWLPLATGEWAAPARSRVLDAASEDLVDLLEDVVPGLLDAELTLPEHARALAALDVPRLGVAQVAAALAGLSGEPDWWRRLYAALLPIAEVDPQAREELGALPVPLADGRTVSSPRGVLVFDADPAILDLLASVDVSGLRIVHPDAVHPLLLLLGAQEAGPVELLDSAALREAVHRSVEEAEAGLDTADLVRVVLRLVEHAGVRSGEQPWLSELALPGAGGEWHRADEYVLPDSTLRDLLARDAPVRVLAAEFAESWPREVLAAVGVIDGFALVVDELPTAPEHDLPDEEEWWDALPEPPNRLVGIRDLDLIADTAWPRALRLLAGDPVTARALRDPDGHPAWWISRHALLAGRAPRHWRLSDAEELTGLYDPVPDTGLDRSLLELIGVRADLVVEDVADASDLLARLGDPDRQIPAGVVLRAHAELADADVDPARVDLPDHVRVLSGGVADAESVVVVDLPWLFGVVPAERVLATPSVDEDTARALAELLDLPLASEELGGTVLGDGDPVSWQDLGAVRVACELLDVPLPEGGVVVHDRLVVVDGGGVEHEVPWWTADGVPHAADTPEGLARALAWTSGRWAERHAFAALVAEPTPAVLLG
ncbi:sacsin N-terminal ATP-binding-like domain-containing protein [Umezawaea beigongshangensis]|uniref:sacsin N-terminal ATP-binding-like domain-containing protein n=1 Tax=Umezawaea beigongshangensis TaxID=2780383 RepID=UPI0018F1D0E6|nr:hypothetical protein [Umezawaea beigongshangensis]